MDWVDEEASAPRERFEEGSAPRERFDAQNHWRESRGDVRADLRTSRKGLEDRLETWVSRGRELVDGVSGTRPGSRPGPRGGAERSGPGGRSGLDGLGRWVEGRLDWLLDDRDDWREPWQEADRPNPARWEPTPAPQPLGRTPLEAISRRGQPSPAPGVRALPAGKEPVVENPVGDSPVDPGWPEEENFRVARWRREEPSRARAANPLADPSPVVPPPGRPLPRSTRRR